jgi:putative RecB family exonuclease
MAEEQDTGRGNVSFVEVPVYARRKAQLPSLTLSPSSHIMFRQCRQLYKFVKIDNLADRYCKPRPYYTMANHVHATLRDFLSLVPLHLRTVETIENLLRRNWRRYRMGFRDKEDERRWAQKALSQVRAFVASFNVNVRPHLVEVPLEAQITRGLMLRGRLDRVDKQDDSSLHVIDYKTGSMPEELDWTQLRWHGLLLSRRSLYPVRKLSFLYLGPMALVSTDFEEDDLEHVRWDVLTAARAIRREKLFAPTPGPWCRGCDFAVICPKGIEVGGQAEAERQLELWRDFWLETQGSVQVEVNAARTSRRR